MGEQPIDGSLGVVILFTQTKLAGTSFRCFIPCGLTVKRNAFFDCAAVKPIILSCSICSADGSGPAFVVALAPTAGRGSSISFGTSQKSSFGLSSRFRDNPDARICLPGSSICMINQSMAASAEPFPVANSPLTHRTRGKPISINWATAASFTSGSFEAGFADQGVLAQYRRGIA